MKIIRSSTSDVLFHKLQKAEEFLKKSIAKTSASLLAVVAVTV